MFNAFQMDRYTFNVDFTNWVTALQSKFNRNRLFKSILMFNNTGLVDLNLPLTRFVCDIPQQLHNESILIWLLIDSMQVS